MKKDYSVSISGSGSESSGKGITFPGLFLLLFLLLTGYSLLFSIDHWKNETIDDIYLKFRDRIEIAPISRFQPLLLVKKGNVFNYQHLRKSIENLYKIGSFDNIEIKVREKPGQKLDIYFILLDKYLVRSLKIRQVQNVNGVIQVIPFTIFARKTLKNAIFAVREGAYYDAARLNDMVKEVRQFFNARGYFRPAVTYEATRDHRQLTVTVKLLISPGPQAVINKVDISISSPGPEQKIHNTLALHSGHHYYPTLLNQRIEKLKKYLKQKKYYFPEITVTENFPGENRRSVDLNITVNPGYRYVFNFKGMQDKVQLITSIWEKKVFEKWAERESRSRILYYLKNKGYLNATVNSKIEEKKGVKIITFSVKRGRKYTLRSIYFQGNKHITEKKLRELIESDDSTYARLFHLRLNSLLLDQEVLRLYYYSQGFPTARVSAEPKFVNDEADIYFKIDEGKKFTVDTLLFDGNRFFTAEALYSFMQTRPNGPFVEQTLYKDIEKLKRIYYSYGFDDVVLRSEISPGTEKSILIQVREGKSYKMGDLITIGAAPPTRHLLEKLFPLQKDAPYDQLKVDAYKNDIDNSSLFNQFKIVKIKKEPDIIDILIKVNPDRSIFYGFGIGWEDRKGMRGTLEYQERNVLNSYSTFSAMVQLGTAEKRGLLSYDTPYFLKTRLNSSLKLWGDNEIYPSYEFYRYGIDQTLIKRLTPNSYMMGSFNWYKTTLKELKFIPPPGRIDQLETPFDTTALNFSYVKENRDDPFNPTKGSFLSSDLKIGVPLLEKSYSFIKFRWSYQKNIRVLKTGTFAASVRNALAAGEMSVTERFFAGGVKTFRGTYRDRLGPEDPVTQSPVGGNALVLFNFETTFPFRFLPVNDLYYAVFADFGNVFPRLKDMKFSQLQSAIGFSLKYKTRMGPLRFDVAWNLNTGEPKFHIGIGNVF